MTKRTHTEREFATFMNQLKPTISPLSSFVDFNKVRKNAQEFVFQLNTLNSLLGCRNLNSAVYDLWRYDKRAFDALGILIAVRDADEQLFLDSIDGKAKPISDLFNSPTEITRFIINTGLDAVLMDKQIKNLCDYVFGVEVGLDSNARKNRGGKLMEKTVSKIIAETGCEYEEQVSSKVFPELQYALGFDKKTFDFAVYSEDITFLIETNFYSKGGSKLNEVARSYTEIGPKVDSCPGFKFVWVTDGVGWRDAENKFKEAYMSIQHVYNLTTFCDFVVTLC